jgi:type II secretory pathway pseudopilin PulG
MAVMAVIAILLSVAAIGIQGIEKGQATTAAVAVTEALFEEARSTAVGRGTRPRLLIHNQLNDNDPTDRQRYLSFLCIAAEETDPQGQPTGNWEILTRGTQLPGGVYYSPEESRNALQVVRDLGAPGEVTIELPGEDHSPKKCIYYEFNSQGVCVDSQAGAGAKPGGAVVLVGGVRPRDEAEPIVSGKNQVGFVVWRNGRTSLFRNPKQLEQ